MRIGEITKDVIKESIEWHLTNQVPFFESVFRAGSENYYKLFNNVRQQYNEGSIELTALDRALITETDIGKFDMYEGKRVPLDSPMQEAEYQGRDVDLNKPKRGGRRKYQVYVKDPKTGNVKKVSFGDNVTGLTAKISDPEARKNFAARHRCDTKKDKTKAGYWSCNLPRYAKSLGLSGGGNFYG